MAVTSRRAISGLIRFLSVLLLTAAVGCSQVLVSSPTNTVQPDAMGYFLPKGLIQLQLKPKENSPDEHELIIKPIYVPDPKHFYTLHYDPSAWYNDSKIKINVSKAGLLQSIETTTKDETVEIINKLLAIATEAAKIPLMPGLPKGLIAQVKLKELLNVMLDPDNKNQVDDLTELLKQEYVKFELQPLFTEETYRYEAPRLSHSVYYRPLLPYRVTFKFYEAPPPATPEAQTTPPLNPFDPAKLKFIRSEIVYLPNKAVELSYDLTRSPFVEKKYTLTFDDGVLQETTVVKPSEVLSGLEIPYNLVKAIVALPTTLIQFKIDTTGKEKEYIEKQKEKIEAYQKLIDAQTELLKSYEAYKEAAGKSGQPGVPPRSR